MRHILSAAMMVALVVGAVPAHAQARDESRLLREAAALESRGDFEGAEGLLRQLLQRRPDSSGGLFALERVLRAKGEPGAILPVADSFLAHDPASSGVRYLKLRVLAEVDSLEALEDSAERWFELQPDSEAPYREVARVYERAFGAARALDVLRRGRGALGDPSALALEMGDLLVVMGRRDQALDEWVRAVGDDGAQAVSIARRVAGLPDGVDAAARRVVAGLADADEPGRRRAAAQIALEMGLEDEALELSARAARDMEGRTRASFLADVARRGREGAMARVASWAYSELGQDAASPGERRQFDQRLVELSLADGDTTAALEAQHRVVESFTPGSADRRRATAQLIRLEAGAAPSDELQRRLDAFREEFSGAPELDELGATVAGALLTRGDTQGAAEVLEGIQGPRSSLERGYLLLDDGQVAQGRGALLMAVSGLEPAEATEVIQFAGLLGRVSPPGAQLLARAGVLAHQGRGEAAAALVADSIATLDPGDQAAMLSEGARMAERGGAPDVAAELRARILLEHADAAEAAEASLELARFRASSPAGLAEAIRLLEDLVTSRPNAAVAPDARRELERLRGRGGA